MLFQHTPKYSLAALPYLSAAAPQYFPRSPKRLEGAGGPFIGRTMLLLRVYWVTVYMYNSCKLPGGRISGMTTLADKLNNAFGTRRRPSEVALNQELTSSYTPIVTQ